MNQSKITVGDIVEYQGRCWVVTGKERSLFGGSPVYHLVVPGDPSRVGPWR